MKSPKTREPDTLGASLRARRIELGLTLEDIMAETRIQKAQLEAIEKDSYEGLDHSTHTLGFVRRYAKQLGLDETQAGQAYLDARGQLPKVASRVIRQRIRKPVVGSKLLGWLGAGLVIMAILIYLIWQLSVLASPPRLNILDPQDNQVLQDTSLEVRGQTTPGAEVKINGQIVYVDEGGNFVSNLELSEGLNIIKIEAVNSRNRVSTVERSVLVRAGS